MGEAAAGAAWAEAGTAVAEGAVRQAAVGGTGQRDALGQRLAARAAGLREVGGAALAKTLAAEMVPLPPLEVVAFRPPP